MARRMEESSSTYIEEGSKVRDYRGVTIMSIIYKIYASVLMERLREEIEQKGLIPSNQTGFRREMGIIIF